MRFDIEPYEAAGALRLGTSIDLIKECLGTDFEVMDKYEPGTCGRVYFEKTGVFVDTDRNGLAVAFEFCTPADPVFKERQLLQTPYQELLRLFKSIDPACETSSSGLASNAHGIKLWSVDVTEDSHAPPQAALVFERGYFEKDY